MIPGSRTNESSICFLRNQVATHRTLRTNTIKKLLMLIFPCLAVNWLKPLLPSWPCCESTRGRYNTKQKTRGQGSNGKMFNFSMFRAISIATSDHSRKTFVPHSQPPNICIIAHVYRKRKTTRAAESHSDFEFCSPKPLNVKSNAF